LRPTHKELSGKIKGAASAVTKRRIRLVEPLVIAIDAQELGYDIRSELLCVLSELLTVCTPELYVGHTPPQKSYETMIKNQELFAFKVNIERFKDTVFVKFCLVSDVFYLVSLHRDRI